MLGKGEKNGVEPNRNGKRYIQTNICIMLMKTPEYFLFKKFTKIITKLP